MFYTLLFYILLYSKPWVLIRCERYFLPLVKLRSHKPSDYKILKDIPILTESRVVEIMFYCDVILVVTLFVYTCRSQTHTIQLTFIHILMNVIIVVIITIYYYSFNGCISCWSCCARCWKPSRSAAAAALPVPSSS